MGAWTGLLKQTFEDFSEDKCTELAAALSYYTIFSLPPLLMLLLLLLGVFMDPQRVQELLATEFGTLLGPGAREEIVTIMQAAERPDMGRGIATLIGVVALIFGATGAFAQLQSSLNRVWEVAPDPSKGGLKNFIGKRLFGFGIVLTIAFLLIASLVVSTMLSAFGTALESFLPAGLSQTLLHVAYLAVTFVILALLFALIYKYLPDAIIAWHDVWVGGAVTALLFVAGKFAIGLYMGRSDPGSAFGAAGTLALLLLWIYYSATILFLGAEFTQAWAVRRGEGIRPEPGAVRIVEGVKRSDG